MKKLIHSMALVILVLAIAGCSPAAEEAAIEEPAPAPEPATDEAETASLYDRLGGEEAIAAVVSRFIDVLGEDDVLNANAAIKEARERVDQDQLKAHVTALVCQASGGPQEYAGRTMAESHANLSISSTEWDQMIQQFVTVLDEFEVPEAEKAELLAIMDTTKADIVLRPDE